MWQEGYKKWHTAWGLFCAIYFLFIHTGVLSLNSILSTYMFEKSRLSSWLLCNIYKNSKTQHVLISRNSYNKDFTFLWSRIEGQRRSGLWKTRSTFQRSEGQHVNGGKTELIKNKEGGVCRRCFYLRQQWQICNKGNFMNVNNPAVCRPSFTTQFPMFQKALHI